MRAVTLAGIAVIIIQIETLPLGGGSSVSLRDPKPSSSSIGCSDDLVLMDNWHYDDTIVLLVDHHRSIENGNR